MKHLPKIDLFSERSQTCLNRTYAKLPEKKKHRVG